MNKDANIKLIESSKLIITGTRATANGVTASGITSSLYELPSGDTFTVTVDTNKYESVSDEEGRARAQKRKEKGA